MFALSLALTQKSLPYESENLLSVLLSASLSHKKVYLVNRGVIDRNKNKKKKNKNKNKNKALNLSSS